MQTRNKKRNGKRKYKKEKRKLDTTGTYTSNAIL